MTKVINREGVRVPVDFNKILVRIQSLAEGLSGVDCVRVSQRTILGVHDGVQTSDLDDLAADTAASFASFHPDYAKLAGRIAVSNLHKKTEGSILATRLSGPAKAFAVRHRQALDAALRWQNDMNYDYFGFKTLERSYLVRDLGTNEVVERPQVALMREALGIHAGAGEGAAEETEDADLARVLETYAMLSEGEATHATPIKFHSGSAHPTLASCFLLPVEDDSIDGIYHTLHKCALISKNAGGIGVSISNVRATNAPIHSTGGRSNGILPMIRVFEATARYVDQGGGKRKGAIAMYLEPWHADVRVFLDMKKNHGADELRARDLFYALWVPDLFMRRVQEAGKWTLFCPSKCGDLVDLHGEDFDRKYEEYEWTPGVAVATVEAQELWFAILDSQVETGTPYMLYKDACNRKSNQKHLGTIRSSNLCTEIVQFSSADEIAVCNLASIALPKFVREKQEGADAAPRVGERMYAHGSFDFGRLHEVVRILVRNLNRVIDINEYAREEARRSNLRHRPMGLGVQGLADTFAMLDYSFDSDEARALNKDIFEAIYFAALSASCEAAEREGAYETYAGSPASQGILQFDMWGVEVTDERWDWSGLRARIQKHGLRNSLLVAPMPTASTAQILGNNECFEPFTSNVYVRRVLAGQFPLVNRHLVRDLEKMGLWTEEVRQLIIAGSGSVQHVPCIPDRLKDKYKTVWEMSMRVLIDMSADRGAFIDQSQSLNLFVAEPNHTKLSSMHFHSWKKGLKTGMYYLRTKPAVDAVKVAVPVEVVQAADRQKEERACRRDEPDCLACSA